ncbi:unnamed protein product [marine sediment metagenome]|uniref:General secretion pathway protein GspM n=1 Tax=marine sediment metagenome TaxID=412755 RepID=X0SSM0_9ZZZZ
MKDIYKNPMFYYLVVPVVAALWPFLVWMVNIPDVAGKWQKEKAEYTKAEKIMAQILAIDPDRLDFANSKKAAGEFSYADAVDEVTGKQNISANDYKISSGMIVTSKGQKSQTAKVVLNSADITQFSKFVSDLQLRWADLQCSKVKLTRKKGLKDVWKVDLDFKYYF